MRYSDPVLKHALSKAISLLEYALAAVVVVGSFWYLAAGIAPLFTNVTSPQTFFFDFIYLLLTVVIGLEVARLLITHKLVGILEILGFVMARKLLLPETTTLDILIIMLSFSVLIVTWIMLKRYDRERALQKKQEESTPDAMVNTVR